MNKLSKITALIFMASAPVLNSYAQTAHEAVSSKPAPRLSIGANLISPLGKFGNKYDGGYGAYLQADVPVLSDKLYATVNTGINRVYAQENAEGNPITPDATLVPVKAGLKYFPVGGLYVQGEAGATFLTNKGDFTNAKTVSFTYAPQVGYLIPVGQKNKLDASIRYEGIMGNQSVPFAGNFIGIKLGYAFSFTN